MDAKICCVQFSPPSTNLLFFGSSDHKVYGYDLRHTRIPWCSLAGHRKSVSYVKFIDAGAVVTASTDNSLKLWDLKKTSSSGLSSDSCVLNYKGHSNEKVGLSTYFTTLFLYSFICSSNLFIFHHYHLLLLQNFVGLSVLDGYIACGSESNEV